MNRKPNHKPDLFKYLDYRKFLKDYYEAAKQSRAGFSFRSFSKKAGFGSSNLLKLVMDGDRNLSDDSIEKFMMALELNKQEQVFFKNLVYFNQAKNHAQKDRYYQKILQSQKWLAVKPLEKHQYEYYSNWYHAVVRELIMSSEFKGSVDWLSQKIRPQISAKQIEKSLELLEQIGFIKKNKNGDWNQSDAIVTTGPELHSVIMMNYHKSLLDLTKEQLDKIPPQKRDVSALTLGIDEQSLPIIKKMIQEFRESVLQLVAIQKNPTQVVLFNTQLIPVTEWDHQETK